MTPLKVSIITPIYNVENYITKCIETLTNQTLQDIEIIFVDDCSSDNSMKIVEEYALKDNRIKTVYYEKNRGPGGARNAGIKIAKGEYIGFVDSDDWIDLNFYEKLYTKAKEENADIVQSLISVYYSKDNRYQDYCHNADIEKISVEILPENQDVFWIYPNISMCWNRIYKREMITKNHILFPENMFWEDNIFIFKAAYYCNKMLFASGTRYYYLKRQGSIVVSSNRDLRFDMIKANHLLIDFLNFVKIDKKSYLRAFSRMVNVLNWQLHLLMEDKAINQHKYEFFKEFSIWFKKCKFLDDYVKSEDTKKIASIQNGNFKQYHNYSKPKPLLKFIINYFVPIKKIRRKLRKKYVRS